MAGFGLAILLWTLAGSMQAAAEEDAEGEESAAADVQEEDGEPAGEVEAAPGLAVFVGGEVELTFPSDGATREISVYAEAERNGIYGGVTALAADDRASDEISLYAGYRAETEAGLSYDLSYVRYFYPNDGGDCCGEFVLALEQPLNEVFALSGELTADPETSFNSVTVGGSYGLSGEIALSANFGLVHDEPGRHAREWDLGMTYALSDKAALDLRYYDGSDFEGYLGLALTFDTTLLGE